MQIGRPGTNRGFNYGTGGNRRTYVHKYSYRLVGRGREEALLLARSLWRRLQGLFFPMLAGNTTNHLYRINTHKN